MKKLDVVGKRFGLLTVLSESTSLYGKRMVECICECGELTKVWPAHLISDNTRSCGCLRGRPAHNRTSIIIGQRFGILTVLREIAPVCRGIRRFECRCDCGQNIVSQLGHLQSGHTQSCGCLRKNAAHERGRKVSRGDKYGMLTILREAAPGKWKQRRFVCVCECGRTVIGSLKDMVSGQKRSCGCLKHKTISNLIHGFKRKRHQHPLYLVWRGIKTRCFNPRCKAYKNYGARGITMAAEWLNDPEAFVAWCMAHGWTRQLTIHRINPDGHYEAANCTFISKSEHSKQTCDDTRCRKQVSYILGALSFAA